jgi:RHS repeat-associated protein
MKIFRALVFAVTLFATYASQAKYCDDETDLVYYGYRYYNPTGGRWLSRDPIQENGGCNLYVINQNDTVNDIDNLGEITVTEGPQMLTTGTCGAYSVDFTYTLDDPQVGPGLKSPVGFLVQKVTLTQNVEDCKGVSKNIPTQVFWELLLAWNGTAAGAHVVDLSSYPAQPNSQGWMIAIGEIKYFSKMTTGDLTKNPKWKQTPGRSPNVETQPPWWNFPSANGESTGQRSAGSSWYCCCGPHFSIAFAHP